MVAPYNKLIQNKKCVLDIRVSNKAKKSRRWLLIEHSYNFGNVATNYVGV
jgi:hypothetical protein